MEKNKGLFSFRKHPVGNFLDEKKGRKRKGGRLRRSMGFLMAAALIFNTLPASGLAVSASEQEKGLCEHHPEHTAECGYAEAQPCTHEHGEECYKTVTECVHEHTDECYPETEETEESTGEGSATDSGAEGREPENCTHKCSEESGCITKVLDCHHEHDESCGYKEAQDCGYVCEICNGIKSEDTENTEDTDTDTAKCICETLCTEDNGSNSGRINGDCPVCGAEGADLSACKGKEQGSAPEKDTVDDNAGTDRLECICETLCTEDNGSNSGRINGDCPVCGAEDADLSRCVGEKTEEQEKTGEKVIMAWEWIDPEEYLTDGMLALPGAGRENPAFMEDVTTLLPEKIQAEVVIVNAAENGEETEEDAETVPETEDAEITLTGWECASYPEDGAYEGTYTFTAFLPEGFVLAEDAAALEVKVELGGVEMLAETVSVSYQEASWNGSEVTYTDKTATCTPVESNTEAVTWSESWYAVSGTVTITEPITVTGAVNLILADGCTLNAQKGIVVTKGNSLTIYAQSGGSGTLNATGTTDSSDNASAGIGGSTSSLDSGTITIHGGEIKATGGVVNDNFGAPNYGGAGIGGGSPRSGNGGSSGAITIYGGTITANSGTGNLTGAGIGGGGGNNGGAGSNITIYGGNVTAEAHSTSLSGSGAGIGGGFGSNDGGAGSNIQIHGGTVHATGGYYGAGIGGGGSGNKSGDGTVTISGGIVTAVGGKYAAGIGGGGGYSNSYNGTITTNLTGGTGSVTISGGIVDAKGGAGNSSGNYAGDPIGNGGNTTATATVEETNAIVFENGAGTVCGDVTLDGSYTVPGDYTLNIPAGASLSGSGTLSGGGTFTTENLTENMISVPTDLYYTGEDRSVDITTRLSDELDKGVTICGQTFTVGGWTLAVEKTDDLTYTATYTNNNDNTNTFTKTITLLKSGTKFEGDVKTYNGDTQTTTFNADDTITVKAAPVATGKAPAKAAARLRADPAEGQMVVYVGTTQVSVPANKGEDGVYTMEVSAADVLLAANGPGTGITLTAKFVGNDNMADAAGTVDVKISAVAMAERDGEVIGYFGVSDFEGTNNLFCKEAYADATITLLGDVKPGTNSDAGTTCSTMVDITCTLDLAGHNFASTDTAIYVLPRGNLTIQDSSTGKTGNVSFIKSDGTLTLYGGTFGKIETAYTLASLLAENCAYYKGSTPVPLSELEGQKTLDGTVIVQECQHKDVTPTSNNDGTHTLSCPYCGYTKTAEDCDYGEYTHNDTSHTRICKLCGYQNVEAHNIKCTAEASGTVIEVSEACKTCGYGKDLGTVTIHIPKLVYGDLTGVVTAENTLTEPVAVAGNVKNPLGETIIFSDHATIGPPTMATLTGNALLSAGEHKIKINIVIIRDENALAGCLLPFTVDPATLTADMVTLSAESTTYSGKEQKPTVTVAGLTEGTDYEVSYTRDGVVTNDFTSAGTVKITVTGKGNYGGEVEKTFTIKQAESDVGTVTAETLENTLDVSQVVLSRTNQTPAGTLMLTDSTLKYGTNTYTWKFTPDDTVNYKAATGTVQVTVNDTIAPSAEYRLGTDGWKKFVNTVTFGLFCKDFKTVDIRSTDDTDAVTGSGIASTQYYISDQEITDTDSIVWETYTKPISLDALGKYFIYVKVTDNAGNTAVLNSEGIVVYAESTVSPAVFDYTYKENRDCTVQLAMNGNTFKGFTDREGNAVGINDYTIDSDGRLILKAAYLDTLDQGEYAYTVSVNPQGIETDQVTLAYTFTVNVKARELTVTGAAAAGRAYDGTNKVEIMAVTLDGIAGSDTVAVDLSGIQGALSSANAGTYTSVTLPVLTLTGADSGNYILVQPQAAVPTSVTITPLSAVITVGTDTYHKTFGDAAFTLDVTDNNAEADVQYEVTKGTDVVSVENGTVTIQSAGTAEIRVSLPASTNYNAAENKTITVRVDKKSGYTVAALNRNYFYQDGGTDSIDLAALLPKDCGDVTYGEPAVSGNVTYSAAPAVSGGKLSYTLDSGSVNDAGTVTVTVATRNYEDITVTVNVKLTDQIPVSLKTGTEVTLENNILTYGEPLSKLAFNEAEFVTADGESVTGTLAWKEAAATPNAGTASAVWIFTPVEDKYASLEGTAAITVNKAVPTVSAVPTVADRIYNPSVTLKGDDLTGATVTGVDGNTLKGGWNWQSADIVPTVNNNGYAAIFTPEDTTNYETVTRTITVNVAKATPYIAKSPAAAGITYGDTLNASALSGGTVQYGNGAGQAGDGAGSTAAVAGTFTWKEPSVKPVVADSNVTEYMVVFTPSDTANYNPVEAKVTLTVNKAQNAPNMPGSTMDVSNSLEKVGDVSLPEGWEWQASDQDTALEVGKPVSAVAVYAGADKGNYENETVTVAITRSACDHVAGEILYTGAGEKAPTCTEDGLGHRECTKCGSVVESGIVVKAPGHTGGTATCSKRAVCTRCGQPYGDTDGSVHGDTEVRGFVAATCTAGGYTGDTYCKDCGAKTKTGNATPALGHNYTSTVTKEPTTGSEGTRTYTCTRCGHSYTESIPKLPEETHHHSYSGSVTKQPTCTDTGVRTYTCSCGDSYTETIAALGHHYQSSVTKQPTATVEGIMTYTCDRCGHSYTRPIAKLPGDDTSKPGDDTTKPGDDTTKPKDDTTKPGDDAAKPGDTKPDGGIAETRPDTGIPFIKDEDGKIGWDVIRAEEEQAQEGSTINVDMNGSVVVPGDIFDSIKGKDITITFDMGDGIIWSVNGKSITIDKAGDIDFSVQTGVNTVPVDIVNNVTGENYSIQISLAYEGEFGFTAVLSIGLGKENAGYTASLYYYNKSNGELEFICADTVAEDGTVSLAFTHASDYVIAIDGEQEVESGGAAEPAQPEDEAGDSAGKEEELPQTGQAWRPWWFIVVGALVIIMGVGVFFVVKKKKEDENGE